MRCPASEHSPASVHKSQNSTHPVEFLLDNLDVQNSVIRAAYEFNTTKKGRLLPVKTIGEAMENVPAKHFKEAQVWVKTKEPVLLLKTDNKLPTDDAKGKDARRHRLE